MRYCPGPRESTAAPSGVLITTSKVFWPSPRARGPAFMNSASTRRGVSGPWNVSATLLEPRARAVLPLLMVPGGVWGEPHPGHTRAVPVAFLVCRRGALASRRGCYQRGEDGPGIEMTMFFVRTEKTVAGLN